jgi:hypothetical protein
MWPVSPSDVCLISVAAQLPPSPSTIPSTPDKPVLRLVCATTSVENDKKPAGASKYKRMELDISGFILEEDGRGGVLLTQLTDVRAVRRLPGNRPHTRAQLSGLGSWVPGKVINLVTQTMIPKSLAKIGKRAQELQLEGRRAGACRFHCGEANAETRAELKGDDWLPPLLGIWRKESDSPAEAAEEDVEEEDDVDDDAPVSSRTLVDLVEQLRTLTARLSALESKRPARKPAAASSSWLSRFWPFSVAAAADAETGNSGISLVESGVISALGGAASAVSIFALAAWYARRRP